jgi:PadR family transcriptional regulator PadR
MSTDAQDPAASDEQLEQKWEVQLRKGTLELVILAALQQRTLYGLELLKLLQSFPSTAITEGTLYPLLDRLKREQLLDSQWVQEGDIRPRKYYQLTPQGQQKLQQLSRVWRQSVQDIEYLLAHPGPEPITVTGV